MLRITIPDTESWDELRNEFVFTKGQSLSLEHSLVSLSKWEAKWKKPFLSKEEKTREETIDYIRCMTLTQNVDPEIYGYIPEKEIVRINQYIEDPMTATTFRETTKSRRDREIITSELIYYWMIALNIPFECQKWHLNRLLTLVRVCNIKNQPTKKMGKNELARQNAELNALRRKNLNSRG